MNFAIPGKVVIAFSALILSQSLWAGSAVNVKIKAITCFKSLNLCHLVLKTPLTNPECAAATHAMWRPNDPTAKEIMALGTAAVVAQKNVNISTSGTCIEGLPVLNSITIVDGEWQ